MSKYNVTMVFEDGRSVQISADENDTIYMASLRNKIRLMTDCLEGACATCKAVCVEGEYDLDEYSDEALTDEEYAQREVLTCQMHARSDCVLEFSYEAGIALRSEPQSWDCRVAAVEKVSSTVIRLDITADESEQGPPAFLPGQYVHLSVPGTPERRSYSFANPPHVTDGYSFYIKVLDHGVMSSYVGERAAAGDAITMTGPFGKFYLRTPERPILMVAGGTGLAPMLSMMDHMIEIGATSQPIHLLCGANQVDELFCLDQLASYRDKGLDLTTEFAVVEDANGWHGAVGHVTQLLRDELIGAGPDIYLCGPPPMIEAGQSWLTDRKVDEKLIHVEKFLPS
jgi:benzoate/toluate 1,2-dioxygenase reductase subunit